MKVREMCLQRCMSHDDTMLTLPDHGVVVIMGINGSGKSSFVEMVAFAHWGKTLRGTPIWRHDAAGALYLISDRAHVRRTVTAKGTKKLQWKTPDDEDIREYDTQSKAEAELGRTVGSMDLWRRTHVFSSADAANFSTATDSERKIFFEKILGIDRFDIALKSCRELLSSVRTTFTIETNSHSSAQRSHAMLVRTLELLEEPTLDMPDPPEPLEEECTTDDLAELSLQIQEISESAQSAQDRPAEIPEPKIHERYSAAEKDFQNSKRVLELAKSGKCSTCEQTYELASAKDAELSHDRALAVRNVARDAHEAENIRVLQVNGRRRDEIFRLQSRWAELVDAQGSMRASIAAVRGRNAAISDFQKSWELLRSEHSRKLERYKDKRREINGQILDIDEELDNVIAELRSTTGKIAELEVCEKVLGIRGVRVQVFSKALGAAEVLANTWLAPLGKDIQVRIRPYTELKGGGISDTIGFEVDGVGGRYGYKASSGGERRRIDVAILLAFAEVHAASSGCPDGTLWMDEVFDALDGDGCVAAAEMLADIGSRRCVVVITHREDLAREIKATARYRVDAGQLIAV